MEMWERRFATFFFLFLNIAPSSVLAQDSAHAKSFLNTEQARRIIEQANAKLYRWPQGNQIVRFTITPSFVEEIIGQASHTSSRETMDAAQQQFLDALRQMKIRGTYHLRTGVVDTEVSLAVEPQDPIRKDGIMSMKHGIYEMVRGVFMTLDAHRIGLLPPTMELVKTVTTDGASYEVTVQGKNGPLLRYQIDATSLLPTSLEADAVSLQQRFSQFVPVADVFLIGTYETISNGALIGKFSIQYTNVSGLQFPSLITINGQKNATVRFSDFQVS